MAKDTDSEMTIANSQIPPPNDPFPTYQTPYPRHTSQFDDQNPFVHFRRFADSQIASFFTALPTFFGTLPKGAGNDERKHHTELDASSAVAEFKQSLEARASEFERRFLEIMDTRHSEAEGSRKQAEQEWEERRIENEKRLKDELDRWTKLLRGEDRQSDLENQYDTELDLYDGMSATTAPPQVHRDHFSAEKGRTTSASRLQPMKGNGEDEYQDEPKANSTTAANLDPAHNEAHAFGWWLQNEYSPLRLKRPLKNQEHNVQISNRLDWEAAFNDLLESNTIAHQHSVSSNQTKEPVWSDNLLNTSGAARLVDDGVCMLAQLRSDFSSWRWDVLGIPETQSNEQEDFSWISQLDYFLAKNWRQAWDQFGASAANETANDDKDDLNSRSVIERIQEVSNHESEEQTESSKEPKVRSSSSETISQRSSSHDGVSNSILSTLTTTRTRTLADGSVETKRVLKQRFSDGSEETNESIEVYPTRTPLKEKPPTPAQQGDNTENKSENSLRSREMSSKDQRIGKGWFWN